VAIDTATAGANRRDLRAIGQFNQQVPPPRRTHNSRTCAASGRAGRVRRRDARAAELAAIRSSTAPSTGGPRKACDLPLPCLGVAAAGASGPTRHRPSSVVPRQKNAVSSFGISAYR
jgi:hypothetical protein